MFESDASNSLMFSLLDKLKARGVKVTYPEKEQFREMVQPMYDEFKKDPEMKKTIEAIQAIK